MGSSWLRKLKGLNLGIWHEQCVLLFSNVRTDQYNLTGLKYIGGGMQKS